MKKSILKNLKLITHCLLIVSLFACGKDKKQFGQSTQASLTSAPAVIVSNSIEDDVLTEVESAALSPELAEPSSSKKPRRVRDVLGLFPMKRIASSVVEKTSAGTEVEFFDQNGQSVDLPKVFVVSNPEGIEVMDLVLVKIKTKVQKISLSLLIDRKNGNSLHGFRSCGVYSLDLKSATFDSASNSISVEAFKFDRSMTKVIIHRTDAGELEFSVKTLDGDQSC